MANLFVNLPLPAMNGPGAAVATDTMGGPKTIVVAGTFPGATITVEASTDGGVVFAPIPGGLFSDGDREITVFIAAEFMRVNVRGRKTSLPFSANIDVGASDGGALFATIPMPALNGPGAAVNVSTFEAGFTFIAGGEFAGATITVEVSEDGVGYAPVLAFAAQGGLRTAVITGDFVRANVSGRKNTVPFTGTLSCGAIAAAGGGAGGLTDVEDEGVSIGGGPFTVLDFAGGGVTATDAGGGTALITIPGAPPATVNWQDEGVLVVNSGTGNFVGGGVTVTNVAGVATVTIPGTIAFQDEGVAVLSSATLNFVGAGVVLTNVAGVATATIAGGITGVAWQEEGGTVVTSATANFVGPDTTVTNVAGVATITTKTNPFSPPEKWVQNEVAANQNNVPLSALVSTSFDDITMMRAGSVVGIRSRLTEAVSAGTLTLEVTKNGAAFGAPLTLAHTSGANPTGGQTVVAPGTDTYVAGDVLAIRITTTAGFLPITTDIEAWLECVEAI